MRRNLIHFEPTVEPEAPAAPPAPEAPKTFSQADLDRIVTERLARQKAQFGDYDELKNAAEELKTLKAASQTELERAQERATQLEREATEAKERAQRVIVESAIVSAAAGKLADPSDAVALVDRKAIELGDDGTPTNVAALVDALIAAKPHLAATTRKPAPADLGARGGAPVTDAGSLMALGDKEFLAALRDPGVAQSLQK